MIKGYDSPIARAIRGYAFASMAEDTHDPEALSRALVDVRVAKDLLPGNPVVLSYHLFAQVVAANIYGELDAQTKKDDALEAAEDDFDELSQFKTLPWVRWTRALYLDQYGQDDDDVLEECRDAWDHGAGLISWTLIAELYGRGLWWVGP